MLVLRLIISLIIVSRIVHIFYIGQFNVQYKNLYILFYILFIFGQVSG